MNTDTHGLDAYFTWAHRKADRLRRYRLIKIAALMGMALAGCTTAPPLRVVTTTNPPQFFSGIVTYHESHVQKLVVGSDRFLSCAEALQDTAPSLMKGLESAPQGWSAKGICIPVPTLDVSDLVPRSLF